MNLLDLFRRNPETKLVANRDDLLACYKKVRTTSLKLNNRLAGRVSKDILYEGGKKLGILKGNTLIFNNEDESAILMDYCIYNVRRNGRNGLEQYLIECPPDPESDETTCLQAMQHGIYSLFVVESVERGLGATMRDLLSQEVRPVLDIGLGSSSQPGLVLASRMLPYDGFSITGGAALPVGVLSAAQQRFLLKAMSAAMTPDDNGNFDPARLIRACLSGGSSSQIQYQALPEHFISPQRITNDPLVASVGRNSPCPCGSGRKSKHCCMKNR